jgi:glycosyltransferase involved in cell wall biosynthesis
VKDRDLFHVQRFYYTDISILEELGYKVILSNKIHDAFLFWRYDIVFAYFYKWSFFVALIATFFSKRIYFTGGIDDLNYNSTISKRYFIQKILFKLCYFLSTSCIIVSESDKINIERIYKKRNLRKISFSEHSIDVEFISKQASLVNIKKHFFSTIAWMENIENVNRKGVDLTLFVFKFLREKPEFRKYHLYIIGKEGVGSEYLKSLASDLGLSDSIHFTGAISEIEKIYKLLESQYYFQLSKYEGFGLAAIEAIACRNIVIHSGRGGLKYTMNDNNIIFNIHESFQIEAEKLYMNMLSFDSNNIELAHENIRIRFSNNRRKKDIEEIFLKT